MQNKQRLYVCVSDSASHFVSLAYMSDIIFYLKKVIKTSSLSIYIDLFSNCCQTNDLYISIYIDLPVASQLEKFDKKQFAD